MNVILTQDVEKLGSSGAVVKVADGFARNYLLPRGLAVLSTPAALKMIEQDRQRKNEANEKLKQEAESLKTKLAALAITVSALVNEDDKESLYGSVTSQDIVAALKDEGYVVDKSAVMLAEPIKALGVYEVPVKVHPEVTAKIKLWIVKK